MQFLIFKKRKRNLVCLVECTRPASLFNDTFKLIIDINSKNCAYYFKKKIFPHRLAGAELNKNF